MSLKKASVAAALAVSMVSTPVLAQSAAPLSVAARSGADHQRIERASWRLHHSVDRDRRDHSRRSRRDRRQRSSAQPLIASTLQKRIAAFGPLFFCPRSRRMLTRLYASAPISAAMQLDERPSDRRRRPRLCRPAAGGRAGRPFRRDRLRHRSTRVAELRAGHDRTNEIDADRLARSALALTDSAEARAAPTSTSSPSRRRSTAPIGPIWRRCCAATETVGGLIDSGRPTIDRL